MVGNVVADPVSQLRVPPHSTEAEQSTLGSVLQDNASFEAASEMLGEADFYRLEHRWIWNAVATLVEAGKPADVVTVFEQLRARKQAEDCGGLAYLNQLQAGVASARNVAAYAAIVRRHAVCRQIIAEADVMTTMAYRADAASPEVMIEAAVGRLLALHRPGVDEPQSVDELLLPWLDELERRASGQTDAISLGLTDLDRLMAGGVRRGEVMIIGARPSMGKSALLLGIARAVAAQGPVLLCSLEDAKHMLVSRHVAATGRVNLADLRAPAHVRDAGFWDRVTNGVEYLRGLPMYVDDVPALALHEVRRKAVQVQRDAGDLLVLMVDYLQLMEGEGESRAYELAAIARGLKRLAKALRCAVVVASQLNRKADELNAPPRLDHLAESGGLEQAADLIALLWREARRHPTEENKHVAQLELAKQKNGPTGTVHLFFDGATQRFEDAQHAG